MIDFSGNNSPGMLSTQPCLKSTQNKNPDGIPWYSMSYFTKLLTVSKQIVNFSVPTLTPTAWTKILFELKLRSSLTPSSTQENSATPHVCSTRFGLLSTEVDRNSRFPDSHVRLDRHPYWALTVSSYIAVL